MSSKTLANWIYKARKGEALVKRALATKGESFKLPA